MTLGLLLWSLISSICALTVAADCTKNGWFGSNCQYMCHCNNNMSCNATGECISEDMCQRGWFGPSCQYSDLATSGGAIKLPGNGNAQELIDGNDKTCLSNSTEVQSVKLMLTRDYLITWLRMSVNDSQIMDQIQIQFTTNSSNLVDCRNGKVFRVSDYVMDVYCDIKTTVKEVIITGSGVKALCSVYISGGRNVALKNGNTSQSSLYGSSISSKAVDGNINGNFYNGTCTHTAEGEKNSAWWRLIFSQPTLINRFVIYNRVDGVQERLQGFILNAFSATNNITYQDQENKTQKVYTVVTAETQDTPITDVIIQATYLTQNYGYILTLCEVEIYGDSTCNQGMYGPECDQPCQCGASECFVSTGACRSGCVAGYHGAKCDQQLPQEIAPTVSPLVAPIAGGVAAFIAVLIIIAIICIIFWRKHRHHKPLTQEVLLNEENMMDLNHLHNNVSAVSEPTKVTKFADPPMPQVSGVSEVTMAEYINTVVTTMTPSTLIVLKDFETFMLSHDTKFFQEQFLTIPANNDATVTVGLSDENKNKNRYKNICAYDHSRVHLQTSKNKRHGNYINASYVEGYKNEKFIASQGPTKNILEDFVRMLWEQKVEKVVMLTNLIENGKVKCERYWPEVDEIKVGKITIKLATTQVFADCTIRRLQLSKKGEEVQSLKHFHFTSWPDKDIPTAPWGLVDFEQRVAADKTDKPVVVHCSAGVGRTGTFIALQNIMRQAEDTGHLDFFMTVKQLRRDRINMVQTDGQYEFLHRAAQVAMLCMGTTVTSRDICYRIKTLSMISKSGHTNIENEFRAICNVCNEDLTERNEAQSEEPIYHVYENSCKLANKYKNRLSNILPKEFYRVVLQCEDDGMEDYINAVFVPSFSKQNQQILTQLPLPSTVTDFWRLVTQNRVSLIVAFEADTKATDKTIGDYLPSGENNVGSFAHFDVTAQPPVTTKLWEQKKLTATVDTNRIAKQSSFKEHFNGELHVTHLKCAVNLEPENLLALVMQIRSLSPAGEGRILYMCRNGADYCGLLCILSLLLDRLDNDKCLTVPLVVGAIKAIRPQVIPTLDQYKLLYQVLNMYNESLNVYSNFGE